MKFEGLEIKIPRNDEESKEHIADDLHIINQVGLKSIVMDRFMPWLLGEQFKDKDPDKVYAGLKLYEIEYDYRRIVEEYSPTGKDDYFGRFEFCFESGSEYTKDILEAVAMEVYIIHGEIAKVSGYDI